MLTAYFVLISLVAYGDACRLNNLRCRIYMRSKNAVAITSDKNACQITCETDDGRRVEQYNRPNFESCGFFKACANGECIPINNGPTLVTEPAVTVGSTGSFPGINIPSSTNTFTTTQENTGSTENTSNTMLTANTDTSKATSSNSSNSSTENDFTQSIASTMTTTSPDNS